MTIKPSATDMAVEIVAAYVGHNSLPSAELPALIQSVHGALVTLSRGVAPVDVAREPAVPVRKSVTSEFLICLEDGRKFKSLKRHLRAKFNMSPEEYRAKWNLPQDYPMVAPGYAKARSELAKQMGLGQSSRSATAATGRGRR